jgi:16S rRNA C1402 (ribose-2'-O) methylase RsmI
VETEELLSKLELIEEQARHTLEELPQHRAKERQRMIIALAKHIRWAIADAGAPAVNDPESTVRLPA